MEAEHHSRPEASPCPGWAQPTRPSWESGEDEVRVSMFFIGKGLVEGERKENLSLLPDVSGRSTEACTSHLSH
jgi:hypothetical protein